MCGIFFTSLWGNEDVKKATETLKPRGPDGTTTYILGNYAMSFTRLAIIDTSEYGMQPFMEDGYFIVCNGEIYNHQDLRKRYKIKTRSGSDCEVLLPLLLQCDGNSLEEKVENLLPLLDGEFAFVIFSDREKVAVATRDRYGVRPLFFRKGKDNKDSFASSFAFASEAKALLSSVDVEIKPCSPKKLYIASKGRWEEKELQYLPTSLPSFPYNPLQYLLTEAVRKRLTSDRPVGFLLSGGLDSSLIVAIATRLLGPDKITCFSVGLEGSVDVAAAKKVVEFLKIKDHHIVTFTPQEGFEAIEEVVKVIESYDVTTVRASTPQYLLAKYIKQTNIKVILSGEGADEIHGSYRYFRDAPDEDQFQKETERLLDRLYMYDNLRTDRTLASQGLEARVPFLDHQYVQYILELPAKYKWYQYGIEKKILRDAFPGYLPPEILQRSKEAFSDAVSSKDVSWYKTIESQVKVDLSEEVFENCLPTLEAKYYKYLYRKTFKDQELIDGYWLPKFQTEDVVDPSATVLKCY